MDHDRYWAEPGDRIGPYVVGEQRGLDGFLGSHDAVGAGGPVELCTYRVADAAVAAALVRAVEVRAAALRELACPELDPIEAVGAEGSLVWIASPPRDGEELPAWRVGRPWREVLAVLCRVGHRLAAAATIGVPASQVFPEAIRIGPGDRVRVRLTADVLASCLDGAPDVMLGHRDMLYLSPHAPTSADPFMAVYRFCVLVWETLYGQRPVEAAAWQTCLRGQGELRLVAPPRDTGVPREIEVALRRGLGVDPAARWSSMAALLDALAR